MKLQSRSAGIDAIRVAGIAAVIFGHVYSGPLTHQWIYPWHVPLFFVLTGYLWTPGRALDREFRTRSRALAVPYLSWFAIVSCVFLALASLSGTPSVESLIGPLWGGARAAGPYGTFWFVSVLFFTAILYRLVENLPMPALVGLAGAGLLFSSAAGPTLAGTPLGLGLAAPCLAFILAGRWFRQVEPGVRNPLLVGGLLLAAAATATAFLPLAEVDIKQGRFGTPVAGVLISVGIAVGFLLVVQRIPLGRVISRASLALATVGIAVVLAHPLVITALRMHGLGARWILLAAVIIPWTVALLLRRTPLAAVLLGLPRASQSARAIEPQGADTRSAAKSSMSGYSALR
jgi:acyltransferase